VVIPLVIGASLVAIVWLFAREKNATIVSKLIAAHIVLSSLGAVIYIKETQTLAGIPGIQPIHLLFFVIFFLVLVRKNEFHSDATANKYFSRPLILFILIYVIGLIQTATGGSSHSFFRAGFTYTNLIVHWTIVPAQILLMGWIVAKNTERIENVTVIEKGIFLGSIFNGFLIAYFYMQKGALSGGWTTYHLGREAVQEGLGLHSNHIAGVCVYFFIACLLINSKKDQWLKWAGIGFALIGTTFTFSRMAWYAVAAIIIMAIPRMKWSVRIALVLALCLVYWQMHTQIKNRLMYEPTKHEDNPSIEQKIDSITAGRLTATWIPALRNIAEHPWFGTGVGSRVESESGTETAQRAYHTGSTHNAYLKLLLNHGVIGALFMTWLMWYFLREGWMTRSYFLYAVVAMFVMGIVGHEFPPYRGNYLFFLLYGLNFSLKKQMSLRRIGSRGEKTGEGTQKVNSFSG